MLWGRSSSFIHRCLPTLRRTVRVDTPWSLIPTTDKDESLDRFLIPISVGVLTVTVAFVRATNTAHTAGIATRPVLRPVAWIIEDRITISPAVPKTALNTASPSPTVPTSCPNSVLWVAVQQRVAVATPTLSCSDTPASSAVAKRIVVRVPVPVTVSRRVWAQLVTVSTGLARPTFRSSQRVPYRSPVPTVIRTVTWTSLKMPLSTVA